MFTLKSFITVGGLATLAQAHMLLRVPVPYTSPPLQNGPLAADGSNFPCQMKPDTKFEGVPTEMKKGSTQKMGFTGGASHSGGSCQISLTYDNPPTKNSAFKVIHSILGGCPIKNANGNNGNDAGAQAPDEYPFKIPEDIPAGNATLAWSWVNRSGNREFYMNCAPVAITGDGGSESALAGLPDMFIANISPFEGCVTPANFDTQYPNPGKSVDDSFAQKSLKAPEGNCAGGSGGSGAGGSAGAATPAAEGAGGAAATPAAPAVRGRRANFRA